MSATLRAVDDSQDVVIRPVQPAFGADIDNVDLRRPLGPETYRRIREALIRYKVIFFRDQDMSVAEHVAFARQFGELEEYVIVQGDDEPALQVLDAKFAKANIWHTDSSWRTNTPVAAVLHGKVIPEVGGDTMWANGEAAYEGLPDDLKAEIDTLFLVHDHGRIGANFVETDKDREARMARVRALRRQAPMVAHPIVRTHPESGRPGLYLNPALATTIVGMSEADSKRLLDRLHAEYLRPENTIRFRWTTNAVAMWDERSTMHYGVDDYGDAPRVMQRVLVGGTDIPYR